MYRKDIDVFVFHVDDVLGCENPDHEMKMLNDFMSEHRCIVLTRRMDDFQQKLVNATAIEQWRFNLPNPAFQNHITKDFHTTIESVAYVSDDIYFIKNALGSFSKTIYINQTGQYLDYGHLPDLTCRNLNGFFRTMEYENWNLFGEGLIYEHSGEKHSGIIGNTLILDENRRIIVAYAGRYYGLNHYRSCIDFYSLAIRKNKDKRSRLLRKFDDVFMRIFKAETKVICKHFKADAICSIPDYSVTGKEESRFAEMTSILADDFGLENLQPFFHRTSRQSAQKSIISAKDREENIKGSFICKRNLEGKKVIILDDILTTGSTLKEATRTLLSAGASSVICAVLGVNQFSTDYWINDNTLHVFQENNKLRGRVQTLEPFFSNPATNTTTNYEKAVSSLFEKLNETVSSLENLTSDEDDRLF